MSTLVEIESAAANLSEREKQQLLLTVAKSLRSAGQALPDPRRYTVEELRGWIEEDEADMRRVRESK